MHSENHSALRKELAVGSMLKRAVPSVHTVNDTIRVNPIQAIVILKLI